VLGEPLRPGQPGAFEAGFFHQPVAVVFVYKAPDPLPHLLKILEDPAINDLLFEGPDKAFGHPIDLGLFDKGEAGVDAPVFQLVLKMVGQVLGAVVQPQGQTPAGVRRHLANSVHQALRNGLQGGKTGSRFAYVPSHALGVPVLHRHKEPTPAVLHREDPGAVSAPHNVGCLGDDLSLVEMGVTAPDPMGRKQLVFPHEPQHPPPAHLDAVPHPEPGPDLAVPLALKWGGRQVRPDQFQELGVR